MKSLLKQFCGVCVALYESKNFNWIVLPKLPHHTNRGGGLAISANVRPTRRDMLQPGFVLKKMLKRPSK